jgi:hypothetical protein
MEIQEALLVAIQVQPLPAVTVTVPLPPAEVKEAVVAEIEYEQTPFWVTVNV